MFISKDWLLWEKHTTYGTQLSSIFIEDKTNYGHIFALPVAGNIVQLAYIWLQFLSFLIFIYSNLIQNISIKRILFQKTFVQPHIQSKFVTYVTLIFSTAASVWKVSGKKCAFRLFLHHNVHGGLISVTCCVQHLQPLPFLRNNFRSSMLKSSKPCAVQKV